MEQEEITKFLEAIRGHQYELLFLVTLFTGMRQGEVLGLTWDCVDFQDTTQKMRQQSADRMERFIQAVSEAK